MRQFINFTNNQVAILRMLITCVDHKQLPNPDKCRITFREIAALEKEIEREYQIRFEPKDKEK